MSEIKINKHLFDKAGATLKKNNTSFVDQFNAMMKQGIKIDQVPYPLEEYDTKDKDDMTFSLDKLDAQTLAGFKRMLGEMDIPLDYVINGYCRRVCLAHGKVPDPKFKIKYIPYK